MSDKKMVYVTCPISEKAKQATLDCLGDIADVVFYQGSDKHSQFLPDADALIAIAQDGASAEMIAMAPKCKYIAKYGAGVNDIAVDEATRRGIPVGAVSGTNSRSVAEYTLTLILAVYKQIKLAHNKLAFENKWLKTVLRDNCYELTGKIVGIIGMGNIGRNLVELLTGFRCDVRYYDVVRLSPEQEKELGVTFMELDDLMAASDVVSIHCPLMPSTRHLVDERRLRLMKPTGVIINTARGAILDEMALAKVISEGHLLGAGIDVWAKEPADNSHPLCKFDNVVVSPHNGGGTVEAVQIVARTSCINIRSVLTEGIVAEPKYVVNRKELGL